MVKVDSYFKQREDEAKCNSEYKHHREYIRKKVHVKIAEGEIFNGRKKFTADSDTVPLDSVIISTRKRLNRLQCDF